MGEDPSVVATIRTGDQAVFGALIEPHRRELRVHCYRMLGSYSDAEEHTQDTFLRAWRAREQFEGRSTLRAWLYRIATNACVDTLRRRPERRVTATADRVPPSDLAWLQPFPDDLDDIVADPELGPEAVAVGADTIGLAFLATIQLLPARQRAALILRDVLGWSAIETADLLEAKVATANSLLQRARSTMREHRARSDEPVATRGPATIDERSLLIRYMEAHHNGDAAAIIELLRSDIRVTMPPYTVCYDGLVASTGFFDELFDPQLGHEFRLVATRANRQPAAAVYLREPGQDVFRAFSLDVLHIDNGQLVDITTFFVPEMFALFGLPAHL
jgi:RNA polymerase sigma-70 factor (TIGR02960 family)